LLKDYEQRWILCADLVKLVAPVAIGSLYISEYFTETDKQSAEQLLDSILEEYVSTINASVWMDETTKQTAIAKTATLKKYIGYHDSLRSIEATNYYDEVSGISEEKFMEMGLALHVYSTDREFKRFHAKEKKEDWTK
jgi:predicted metalloendopeptidase